MKQKKAKKTLKNKKSLKNLTIEKDKISSNVSSEITDLEEPSNSQNFSHTFKEPQEVPANNQDSVCVLNENDKSDNTGYFDGRFFKSALKHY